MIAAGSIKRGKRTMQNIERQFLKPMITKFVRRYMQFDPTRYPVKDYKFIPRSTMGMMAREFTMAQIAQAMQVVPPDQPAFGVLLENFFNNSSLPDKEKIKMEIEKMYQPKQPGPQEQLSLQKLMAEIEKIKSETVENYAQAGTKKAQTEINAFNAIANVEEQEIERRESKSRMD